ncbi:MAG: VC0807 family protein [Actinocatenispora sp.]
MAAGQMAPPRRRSMRRHLDLLVLVADIAVPTALYYGLRAVHVSIYAALVAGAVFSVLSALTQLIVRRQLARLPLFVMSLVVLSLILTVIGGSPRFILARGAAAVAVVGIWFLISLRGHRPLTFLFTRPLLEGRFGTEKDWDRQWEQSPSFRRTWRVSSIFWGVASLADAVVRVILAYALPIDILPALYTAQYVAFSLVMMIITNIYLAHAGVIRPPRGGPRGRRLRQTP